QNLSHHTGITERNIGHFVQTRSQLVFHRYLIVSMLQNVLVQIDVFFGIEKDRVRRISIPSCPSNLLVVVNNAQRQVEVEHQTNIGYIHTHTKSRGGHHDSFLPTDELELLLCTFVLVHVGMAFGNAGELILQVIGDYVYIPTGRTVYNDTSVLTIFPDVVPHTLQPLMLIYIKTRTVLFQQGDIFTAKAHRVNVRMLHAEKFLDVLLVIMRCSGRKGCYDRTALE